MSSTTMSARERAAAPNLSAWEPLTSSPTAGQHRIDAKSDVVGVVGIPAAALVVHGGALAPFVPQMSTTILAATGGNRRRQVTQVPGASAASVRRRGSRSVRLGPVG